MADNTWIALHPCFQISRPPPPCRHDICISEDKKVPENDLLINWLNLVKLGSWCNTLISSYIFSSKLLQAECERGYKLKKSVPGSNLFKVIRKVSAAKLCTVFMVSMFVLPQARKYIKSFNFCSWIFHMLMVFFCLSIVDSR